MKHVTTVALIVALAWMAIVALAWVFQRNLIYFPFADVPPPSLVGLDDVEQVTFTTEDGVRLHGWFVQPPGRSAAVTVVVFNGNAGNRAYRAPLARRFRERGVAVLLFDYRGYGDNGGRPTEQGLTLDARAARAHLAARADVDPQRVVYFGESLGAAVAIGLAVEHPPAALVLRSPFTSLSAIAQHHYRWLPVRWLLRDRFPSLDRIPHLTCPLLVIVGDRDGIVPAAQGRQLYDAARGPKDLVVIAGADHNDAELVVGPEVIEATLRLLDGA